MRVLDSIWYSNFDHQIGVVLVEVERGALEPPGWKAYIGALDFVISEEADARRIAQSGCRFKPAAAALVLFAHRGLDLERHVA